MRSAMWLLCSSVVCVSGVEGAPACGGISIEDARANQPARFDLNAEHGGAYEVKLCVEKPDGSRERLPSSCVRLPRPAGSAFFEAARLPADSGGGTLVVEVIELRTGRKVHTGLAPIGF